MSQEAVVFSGIFLMKDDKVLLLKRKGAGHMNGFRGVPGGHINCGELMKDGAIRETDEEIGIKISREDIVNEIIVTGWDEEVNKRFVGYYGLCVSREGEPINNEPNKCTKITRYSTNNLPSEITPFAKKALQGLLKDQNFAEV